MKMLRWGLGVGGAEILSMCSGALKNRWAQGEGVKTGYRTKGLIAWAGLARFAEIPALYDNRANLGSQYCDAGIPGGDFPSNHACRAARRMKVAWNRTVGNILFKRISSPAHVIRPLLKVVLSRSLHVKALEFAAFVVRVWENTT